MANHIPIDTTKRLGIKLRRLVDLQREATHLFDELKSIMEAQVDAEDYSVVETQFGLPTGKGATTYNLLTGARADVKAAAPTQMLDWMG